MPRFYFGRIFLSAKPEPITVRSTNAVQATVENRLTYPGQQLSYYEVCEILKLLRHRFRLVPRLWPKFVEQSVNKTWNVVFQMWLVVNNKYAIPTIGPSSLLCFSLSDPVHA